MGIKAEKKFIRIDFLVHKWLDMSIRTKMILCFALTTVVSTLFLGVTAYNYFNAKVMDRYIDSINKSMELAITKTEYLISDVNKTSDEVFSDIKLQNILFTNLKKLEQDEFEKLKAYTEIENGIKRYTVHNENIDSIIILDTKFNMFSYEHNIQLQKWVDENIKTNESHILNLKGRNIWLEPFEIQRINIKTMVLPMVRLIREINTLKPIGYMVINIKRDNVNVFYENVFSGIDSSQIILNKNGDVLFDVNNIFVHDDITGIRNMTNEVGYNNFFERQISGEKYLISMYHIKNCEWDVIDIVPIKNLRQESIVLGNYTVFFSAVAVLIAILLTMFLSRLVLSPLGALKNLMTTVNENNLNIFFNARSNDEIGQLGKSFNNMIETIRNLLSSVKKNEEEKRQVELKLLQAQINPHFLYNTLDNIRWMNEAGENEKVSVIITSLVDFFRTGLSAGNDFIKLKVEIEHVRNYMTIQSLRYGKKVRVLFDIDKEILDYSLPKLTLQPIIENSIVHGMKDTGEGIIISVKGVLQADEALSVVEITDNGKGMSSEKLNSIREYIEKSTYNMNTHFGLFNINQRIKYYFGGKYGIDIDSKENEFTRVTVKIPKKKRRDKCV